MSESEKIYRQVFSLEVHSLETHSNTDFGRQVGGSVYIGSIIVACGGKVPVNDLDGMVTAFELKNKTPDDRISTRWMPSGTVMNAEATYMCIPRTVWQKIMSSPHFRAYKPTEG